jgi:succinate dehydrogenase / fumarate reductase iron-sulfur subunit
MKVTLRIRRFNPEIDQQPWWGQYEAKVDPEDRLLDALNYVKWFVDGTLTYRSSCSHGVCGSDAMQINGSNRLACKTLIRDIGRRITVAPLPAMPILKDLVVDLGPFFQMYQGVKPFFITHTPPPARERLQSPAQRARFDDTTKCILCASCTSSCPSYWGNPEFVGPAAIVNAHRFLFDSRDEGGDARLPHISNRDGVWRCRTIFNCTEACPREIRITRAIVEVRDALLFRQM